MTLNDQQREAVTRWIAAGDTLAQVQRKLDEEFKLSLTYIDVRFLVDDLGLELKSPAPKKPAAPAAPAVPAAEPAAKKGLFDKLKDAVGGRPDAEEPLDEEPPPELAPDPAAAPFGASSVKLEVDRLTRPGSLVSGTVTFSDGVTGKWGMDQYGRLMVDAGKGYKPTPADIQAFQTELSSQLQRMGY